MKNATAPSQRANPPALRLIGPRLHLRPVRLADGGGRYVQWLNNPKVNQYLESRFERHTKASVRRFILATNRQPANVFLSIVLNESQRHIGNIKLGPINSVHRLGDIGILIGEEDCWGKGYATEAIQLLTEHAFRTLNLHKVTASCYADNAGSARAFEKAGFVVEAVRPAHFLCAGRYVDAILLGKINPAELGQRR